MEALLQRPFVRYLIVGGGVYLLELGIILVAQNMGASATVAVALSFWIGLLVSFLLQKFVTFSDKRTHHRIVIKQALAVVTLVAWNFVFTILVTKLLEDRLAPTITRTIALAITTFWNFYLYRTSIFRQPENPIY
jgi:putative flippase GtrA